ncbi:MAG: dUTP diphosphatase [Candidatus Pacebacteria bacterium]|nr:dUTP diphosphatase [Candidatus Paceibacterota bacterium]MCF7856866.1 dUTP diphosphatase [Candidatus Paceibacterota bacterium]
MKMQVVRLNDSAKLPQFAHDTDAGMDLFCNEVIVVASGERVQIKTGIAVAIPDGHAGLIWDKSGLSQKYGLKTLGGVIDSEYRGEIIVGMVNLGQDSYTIQVGDKIAQILIQKVEHPSIEEVTSLEETLRGENGFGSTGI